MDVAKKNSRKDEDKNGVIVESFAKRIKHYMDNYLSRNNKNFGNLNLIIT